MLKTIRRLILRVLDGLTEATPENAGLIFHRGAVRGNLGNYEDAVADFSKAIELVPNYGAAYRGRAICYLRLHDVENALQDIQEGLLLEPENAETHATHGACCGKCISMLKHATRLNRS